VAMNAFIDDSGIHQNIMLIKNKTMDDILSPMIDIEFI
jgi:hypothetical protein